MRAVVYDRYGPPEVLRLEDVPQPVPKEDEVLIKIHATTITRSDCGIREANASSGPFVSFLSRLYSGVRRPKRRILGAELAGEVAAVGATVSEFAVGDRVFGTSAGRFGAHAEFICMRERAALAQKPAAMTFEEAAAVCDGAMLALGCLRQADLRKGRRILVYGASGSIGTAGVQLAKYFGADVTAVCGTKNVELVRSLGADRVIDYTEDPDDPRDIFVAVGPLYRASELIGARAGPLFDEAASFTASELSEFIRAFPRRPPENRRLADFGFREEGAGPTFRFVSSAPSTDDPSVKALLRDLLPKDESEK